MKISIAHEEGSSHGYERRGFGFLCVQGDECHRYFHPGDPGYDELVREETDQMVAGKKASEPPADPDHLARVDRGRLRQALSELLDAIECPTLTRAQQHQRLDPVIARARRVLSETA